VTPEGSAPETTPKTETSNPQAAAAATPAAPAGNADGTPAATPPAFTPNFKYKAFGKEHELEEFWRPLIKDADSEKKVKDLFTKTMAFDDIKARYESTQGEFQNVLQEHQALDRDVRRVMTFLNNGDLDNFFGALRIPEQKVFDWVSRKLEMENMTPEQRQAVESQARERARAYDLEMEKTELEQQFESQAVQARTVQLDLTLARPDVAQAASQWDSRMGQLGAFRELVVQEAIASYHATGQDLSAEQAVAQVLQKYGKLLEPGTQPQAVVPQAPGTPTPTPQVTAKPVIPAVQGRGTSPVKKSPKSIDDLRQMAREMDAANG
jgi:hypothetical protein